jgi:uncharacterized protein YbaP (TraB family)
VRPRIQVKEKLVRFTVALTKFICIVAFSAVLLLGCSLGDRSTGFAWKIKKETGSTVILVPTLHIVIKSIDPLPKSIETWIRESDVVAFEFDFEDKSLLEELAGCRRLASERGSGEKVSEYWSQVAQRAIDDRGLSGIKPATTYPALAEQLLAISLHSSATQVKLGVDHAAMRVARTLRKRVLSIESPCDQVEAAVTAANVWTTDSIEERFLQLKANEPFALIENTSSAWSRGDLLAMRSHIEAFNRRWPFEFSASGRHIHSRNRSIAKRIDEFSTKESNGKIVVFVGMFHFFGVGSLLDELSRMGYRIEEIGLRS